MSAFEKFLQDTIKVEGRTNNLGDNVVVQQQGEGKIEVIAHNDLSGRYLKYLYVPGPRARAPFPSLLTRPCMGLWTMLTGRNEKDQKVPQEAAAA